MSIAVHPEAFIADLERYYLRTAVKCSSLADNYVTEILNESDAQVPKDTGALASSVYHESDDTDTIITRQFGYGGDNEQTNPKTLKSTATYALEVHEDLSMPHPNGGKAKFLEDPSNQFRDNINSRLARDLR